MAVRITIRRGWRRAGWRGCGRRRRWSPSSADVVIASVAKQSRAARGTLDCFAALAMTGVGVEHPPKPQPRQPQAITASPRPPHRLTALP
ncbi:hypothetical protein SPHINGO8AM_150081 [Sphingomonas sp. 8AM]|nr:hypothetical protein SPHINGO8AM_150081 [Sphingomonas sp. 8AM]